MWPARLCVDGDCEIPMSQAADLDQFDRHIEQLKRDVAEQKALVRSMIVRGSPSQAAEDRLRQLQQKLSRLKERARVQHP
jgi:hypothetical protein